MALFAERAVMRQELDKFESLRRAHLEDTLWYLNLKTSLYAATGCTVSVALITLGCLGLYRALRKAD